MSSIGVLKYSRRAASPLIDLLRPVPRLWSVSRLAALTPAAKRSRLSVPGRTVNPEIAMQATIPLQSHLIPPVAVVPLRENGLHLYLLQAAAAAAVAAAAAALA